MKDYYYNETEGPAWGDDHHANWLALKDYTFGPWRDPETGKMNGYDYYDMGEINGLEYYTPNNEDWGAIIVVDNWNKLAEYTHFYEMDDMEYPGSDYAFVTYGDKLVPAFTLAAALPIYTTDNDQPVVCPKCGSRTDIVFEISSTEQHHQCLNCKYEFILIIEGDV